MKHIYCIVCQMKHIAFCMSRCVWDLPGVSPSIYSASDIRVDGLWWWLARTSTVWSCIESLPDRSFRQACPECVNDDTSKGCLWGARIKTSARGGCTNVEGTFTWGKDSSVNLSQTLCKNAKDEHHIRKKIHKSKVLKF